MAEGDETTEESTPFSFTDGVNSVPEALGVLADCVSVLAGEAKVRAVSTVTMDEIRNRAIYELNRENISDAIDDQDDTLPYMAATGSKMDRVIALADNVEAAVNLILNDTDSWIAVDDPEAGGTS